MFSLQYHTVEFAQSATEKRGWIFAAIQRSFPPSHGVDNRNNNELASSKDLTDMIYLRSQSAKVLKNIHSYLFTVDAGKKRGSSQMLTAIWPEEQLSAERLLRIREDLMAANFV